MSPEKYQRISLDEIMAQIRRKVLPSYDLVVGIKQGGVLPAYLAARWLEIPLETIEINFRDARHQPQRSQPEILSPLKVNPQGRRILLCDDVANTGATLNLALGSLEGAAFLSTMVISGNGDISLFGPHEHCLRWPWDREEEPSS